jgi:hypothetical protein
MYGTGPSFENLPPKSQVITIIHQRLRITRPNYRPERVPFPTHAHISDPWRHGSFYPQALVNSDVIYESDIITFGIRQCDALGVAAWPKLISYCTHSY